jgi:hypothetical protein
MLDDWVANTKLIVLLKYTSLLLGDLASYHHTCCALIHGTFAHYQHY